MLANLIFLAVIAVAIGLRVKAARLLNADPKLRAMYRNAAML